MLIGAIFDVLQNLLKRPRHEQSTAVLKKIHKQPARMILISLDVQKQMRCAYTSTQKMNLIPNCLADLLKRNWVMTGPESHMKGRAVSAVMTEEHGTSTTGSAVANQFPRNIKLEPLSSHFYFIFRICKHTSTNSHVMSRLLIIKQIQERAMKGMGR